jgi:hypothetical protein
MEPTGRLENATRELIRTISALIESARAPGNNSREIVHKWPELKEAATLAAIEYELALLEEGFLPPYPPRTNDGRLKWGLAPEQIPPPLD